MAGQAWVEPTWRTATVALAATTRAAANPTTNHVRRLRVIV